MLEAAFRAGRLPWAEGYTSFAREKVRGESRLDGLLEGPGMPRLWVECKNVTMSEDDDLRCSRMPFPSGGSSIWGR